MAVKVIRYEISDHSEWLAYTATGLPPYGGGDASAMSYRTVHEDIDLTGVRDDLATLIRRCVAKDPAERLEWRP